MCQQDLFGLFQCLYPFMTSFICASVETSLPIRFAFLCAGIVGLIIFFFLFGLRRHPVGVVDAAPGAMLRRRKFSKHPNVNVLLWYIVVDLSDVLDPSIFSE